MKPYHIACGSSNLDSKLVNKGRRMILVDLCLHCERIIESNEIRKPAGYKFAVIPIGEIARMSAYVHKGQKRKTEIVEEK